MLARISPIASGLAALSAIALPAPCQSACTEEAQFEAIGMGTPGLSGTPRIELLGAPIVGGPFALRLRDANPMSFGVLYYGTSNFPLVLPGFGATIYPSGMLTPVPFLTDSNGSSSELLGSASLPSEFCGIPLTLQAFIVDPASAGSAAFSAAVDLQAGTNPGRSVFSGGTVEFGQFGFPDFWQGDLNADGRPDVAFGGTNNDSPAYALGLEQGGFSQPIYPPLTGLPADMAFVDFDNDGNQDLVALVSGLLEVHTGDGTGALNAPSLIDVSPPGLRFALADFDGDDILDLALLRGGFFSSTTVSIRLGTGGGGFAPEIQLLTPLGNYEDIEAVDLDQDGHADLLLTPQSAGAGTYCLGRGDGLFDPLVALTLPPGATGYLGPWVRNYAVADFNSDGHLDLAGAMDNGLAEVALALGDGLGGFQTASLVSLTDPSDSSLGVIFLQNVQAGDFDGDGVADLAAATGSSHVRVGLGVGDGTFDSISNVSVRIDTFDLIVGSFDEDAADDVLTFSSNRSAVSRHNGTVGVGLLTISTIEGSIPTAFTAGDALELADLDGNGLPDIVSEWSTIEGIRTWLQVAPGQFTGPNIFGFNMSVQDLEVGDLNGDAVPDVIVMHEFDDLYRVGLGQGDGEFNFQPPVPTPDRPAQVRLADFDGDLILDLALANENGGAVRVYPGLGDGTFGSPSIALAPLTGDGYTHVATGDFNGDGALDLAALTELQQELRVALGNGDGSFAQGQMILPISGPGDLLAVDLTEEGLLDLVTTGESLTIYPGLGDGTFGDTFGVASAYPMFSTGGRNSRVLDLNGDRIPDVAGIDGFGMTVLYGEGAGHFEEPQRYDQLRGFSLAFGDLNGSGLPDAVAESVGNELVILENQLIR